MLTINTWEQQTKLHHAAPLSLKNRILLQPQLDKYDSPPIFLKKVLLCIRKSNYARLQALPKSDGSLTDRGAQYIQFNSIHIKNIDIDVIINKVIFENIDIN